MPEIVEWENREEASYEVQLSAPERLSAPELEQLSKFERRMYYSITHDVLEQMLIGYLIGNLSPSLETDDHKMYVWVNDTVPADKILESGIRGAWFDSSARGKIFDMFLKYYREHRKKLPIDDVRGYAVSKFYKPDEAANFEEYVHDCYGAVIARRLSVDVLVKRFKNRYFCKKSDEIHTAFVAARNNGADPVKAIDDYKRQVLIELSDPAGSAIKESDWVRDFQADKSWMLDMKRHPEKYAGYKCGIKAIDKKTNGFRDGHLTVFVGWHGGYKTTTMVNVAFGLWLRGFNVLYVSLEMETRLMKAKLWSRGAGVNYGRIYNGLISEPQDWEELARLEAQLSQIPDKKSKPALELIARIGRLNEGMAGTVKPDLADTNLLDAYEKSIRDHPNMLKVINVGQSSKMKLSQLEKYIEEQSSIFSPDVVFVDYLDLIASEESSGDGRWAELGDICKYLRNMGESRGFSVVTAAQFKRAAIERIREYGLKNPEKAQFSTDDIAGSNQIGADADNVFCLWRLDQNKLQLFTPKARHGLIDIEKGENLYVVPEYCKVTDEEMQNSDGWNSSSTNEAAIGAVDSGELRSPKNDDEADYDLGAVPTAVASVDAPQTPLEPGQDPLGLDI